MSKWTTIYVLFKEYPDPNGRRKSAPYIQDSADYLADKDALMMDWRRVADVLSYFGYEMANRYYDEENLAGLIYVADTIPAEYPAVSDFIMSDLQAIGLTPWQNNAATRTETFYLGSDDVTDGLLGDMAQRETDHKAILLRMEQDTGHEMLPIDKEYEPCVLLHQGAVNAPRGEVRIMMNGGRSLTLKTVDSIISLHDWLSQHRFPCRRYKYHPKHGDANHKAQTYTDRWGHVERAAQLLTTTMATESLLKLAVGTTVEGDLWYYDASNCCYIFFENQGNTPQHEYHAYHLHPGDKNFDKICLKKLGKVLLSLCVCAITLAF